MNQCTIPDHWDIKELFNYLIDGDPVIARSYSVVETNEDSDTYNEIVNTARRVRLRLAQ
jgi:SepF-like predicted cell division protein (DUF552 family)